MRNLAILVLAVVLGSCQKCRDVDCLVGEMFYLRVVDDNNNDVTKDMRELDFRFENGGAAHLGTVAPGIGAAYVPTVLEQGYKYNFNGTFGTLVIRCKLGEVKGCCGATHEIVKMDSNKGPVVTETNAALPDKIVYVVHL